jgi:hypothetical protein
MIRIIRRRFLDRWFRWKIPRPVHRRCSRGRRFPAGIVGFADRRLLGHIGRFLHLRVAPPQFDRRTDAGGMDSILVNIPCYGIFLHHTVSLISSNVMVVAHRNDTYQS